MNTQHTMATEMAKGMYNYLSQDKITIIRELSKDIEKAKIKEVKSKIESLEQNLFFFKVLSGMSILVIVALLVFLKVGGV